MALLKRSSKVTGQPVECSVGSGAQPWSGPLWLGVQGNGGGRWSQVKEQSDMFLSAAIVEGGDPYRWCQGRHLALGIPFRRWFQGGSRQPGLGLTGQSIGQVRSHLIHPCLCR